MVNTCKLTTSNLVAGVLDTCCTHSCPFSVHSLEKDKYSTNTVCFCWLLKGRVSYHCPRQQSETQNFGMKQLLIRDKLYKEPRNPAGIWALACLLVHSLSWKGNGWNVRFITFLNTASIWPIGGKEGGMYFYFNNCATYSIETIKSLAK